MTDQDTVDDLVLQEIRPPRGEPQTAHEIQLTLMTMRRLGAQVPPIATETVPAALQRIAAARRAEERDGVWHYTPIDSPRQKPLF